ncbi:hypothetical protein JM47_00605 [Ureaplasma diversum]|uniref:Uncharacterized protein n=2 Tax=Ureaplasma diversum TaxID=42094 RepID=A0A084F1E6_9BACT|nr:hypothetical protein [Ureaplasma diversum]AJQ45153.1 hypothetical protein JM47_00605 [Ureaplasma diversum]KEZ24038.1 Hypothetical protein, predicted transmembrane protein [Ureaplasma diversum NCTC 246]
MKKAILITASILGAAAGVVATATFLALNTKQKTYAKNLNTSELNQALSYNNLNNSKVSLKELILGTSKVNDGNYVLYFGSQSNIQHNNFMFNNELNHISKIEDLKNNYNLKFNGDLAKVINNTKLYKDSYKTVPQFFGFVDFLNDDVFLAEQAYMQKLATAKASTIEADKRWAASAPQTYSYDVSKQYRDKDDKLVYFRTDKQAEEFREVVKYLNNYLKKEKLVDLYQADNPGIILFYTKENINKGPTVYFGSIKKQAPNPQNPRAQQNQRYPAGNQPYNADSAQFGGQFNAAIFSFYGNKIR